MPCYKDEKYLITQLHNFKHWEYIINFSKEFQATNARQHISGVLTLIHAKMLEAIKAIRPTHHMNFAWISKLLISSKLTDISSKLILHLDFVLIYVCILVDASKLNFSFYDKNLLSIIIVG